MEIVASSYPINVSNKTFHNEAASLMCLETSKHFRCLFCLFPCSFGHRTHSPIISRIQILTTRLDFQKLFFGAGECTKILLLNIYLCSLVELWKCQNRSQPNWLFNDESTETQKLHSRAVSSKHNIAFFLLQSLCCLGHPRWRMFKFQLNNSRFYMASRTSSTRIASHSIP